MALLYPTTGFKTIGNNVNPYFSGKNVFTNIWDAGNQVIGILQFTNSVAGGLGLTTATAWSDLEITKAILTMYVYKNNPKTSGYRIAISGTALAAKSTLATITNNSHYTTNNSYASGTATANSKITFDLTELFKTIPDTNSSTPLTSTWYIYIWHSTYTAGSSNSDNYGFHNTATYTVSLEIEGRQKAGASYYDGTNWIPCKLKYYNGYNWQG